MKYCNQCGAQLARKDESVSATEKRFDDYLEGLFWVAALGLGMVLGGMIVIKTGSRFERNGHGAATVP